MAAKEHGRDCTSEAEGGGVSGGGVSGGGEGDGGLWLIWELLERVDPGNGNDSSLANTSAKLFLILEGVWLDLSVVGDAVVTEAATDPDTGWL